MCLTLPVERTVRVTESPVALGPAEEKTFHQGGDAGYITCPTYQRTA
ncbi:hypothetical protein G5C60_39625 [Streptomyces sp. HC44]|uniref:Uncharacterized protein n=1 Tax=Streptomyces scabichelini TaxID=2711217 RepID=A0A6G4VHH7_9ACTN|nr:hypothetical protein [Streptomyces scabichelini]NGO13546.1 hypothetical protein [Streptomyces scabichelini]